MTGHEDFTWRRAGRVILRAIVVGATSGVIGGGLLFFLFGFIGFAGAPLTSKIANGWRALLDPGLEKGLAVGAGIAVGLIAVIGIWTALARRFDPRNSRPWLATLAGAIVFVFNLESLRSSAGWDWAGIATVFGIALLVAVTVWLISPWVLRDWSARSWADADQRQEGLSLGEPGKGGSMRRRR